MASEVKLALLTRYPAQHPITIVSAAGIPDHTRMRTIGLHELDHQLDPDHLTVGYVPPLAVHEDVRGIEGIQWVVARLLGPQGCPWDREQTQR